MTNLTSLNYLQPELILTGTILLMIVVDLLYSAKKSRRIGLWALAGLVLALLYFMVNGFPIPTALFLGSIASDPFGVFFKVLILLATILTILVSFRERDLANQRVGEYYILLVIVTLGLFFMVSATDLIMVYLSIEVVSIMSFVLAGYLRGNRRSSEASLKYVIYGAFSSGIMLFGLSILFGLTGSTNFFDIRTGLMELQDGADLALMLSTVLIFAGLGYKISAVPFHYWTPDVYEGAPTSITAFLSVAPKAAGMALIIRFFNSILGGEGVFTKLEWGTFSEIPWTQLLAVLAAVTMTVGNLIALRQTSVKRMLAYSSIAHAGYMMMALPVLSQQGVYGIMIYAVFYLLMNLGAFYVVMIIANATGQEDYDQFRGLGHKAPLLAILMTLFMFSLTGIPPTAGFIGKFYLFAAVIKAGPSFYWLAIIGALNSVISLYYYMYVVKTMFFSQDKAVIAQIEFKGISVLVVVLAIPTLIFGIYWSPIAEIVHKSLAIFIR